MDISYYSNGEQLTADILNRPLGQIGTKLDELEQLVSLVTGNRVIQSPSMRYNPSDPVVKGQLVYIGDDGYIHPALAVWNTSADVSGIIMPAPSAYVEGLVTSVNTSTYTANVAVKGRIDSLDTTAIANLMPSGATLASTGTWYLSDTEPGKVMQAANGRPYIRIPVIRIDANSCVHLTGAVPFSGYHTHKAFTIPSTASWTEGTGTWTYSGSSLNDLLFFNWTDATITINGVIDYAGKISLSENSGSVVVTSTEDMTGKTVQIFTAVPDSHAEPVVRGIRVVGAGRVNASSENGLVTLGIDGWSGDEPAPGYSDRAVSSLTENGGFTMTKVVSKLAGDGTVTVQEGANGEWSISNMNGPYIRPSTVSLENSTVASVNNALFYVFPNNRASAILGVLSIPKPPTGWSWEVHPFVDAANSTVNVTATMSVCIEADPGTARSIASAGSGVSVSAVATGSVVTGVATGYWTVSGGGTAWLRLSTSGANSADMNIISFGIWLEAVSNS